MAFSLVSLKFGRLSPIIFLSLEALTFLFCLIATPIAQFKPAISEFFDIDVGCFSLFGATAKCGGSVYIAKQKAAFGCSHRTNNMNAGAAFAIISILITLITVIFAVFILLSFWKSFMIPLILCAAATLTLLISWACVADVHNSRMCCTNSLDEALSLMCGSMKSLGYTYGPGFGLMVVAWIIQLVNALYAAILTFA